MCKERIIILDEGADLLPEVVVRERVPANDTGPRLLPELPFAGTGPARGAYEEAVRVPVVYFPPSRMVA